MRSINLELTPSDEVKPCPFCGSRNIVLENTWTAYYCLRCYWGATMQGTRHEAAESDPDLMEAHMQAKKL